jgi:hypothetical protein
MQLGVHREVTVDITPDQPSNFTGGQYYYRVSAVFSPTDENNPGGESLPGEAVTVQVPLIVGLRLGLSWDAIPSAVAYRVYRSPDKNMPISSIRLLTEVTTPAFVDEGLPFNAALEPVALGSLGEWSTVANLTTPRWAHSCAVVPVCSATTPAISFISYCISAYTSSQRNYASLKRYRTNLTIRFRTFMSAAAVLVRVQFRACRKRLIRTNSQRW